MIRLLLFGVFIVCTSAAAHADWVLDGDASSVNFVSTKAISAAEVHRFTSFAGNVGDDGVARIGIDLNSVDTAVDIRDERMRDMLFETERYPMATVEARVDIETVAAMKAGESKFLVSEAQLGLRDKNISLTVELSVAKLDDGRILVIGSKPVIVNASEVGLLDGVEKLREIAGLPSISPAVPVTFTLVFDKQ